MYLNVFSHVNNFFSQCTFPFLSLFLSYQTLNIDDTFVVNVSSVIKVSDKMWQEKVYNKKNKVDARDDTMSDSALLFPV